MTHTKTYTVNDCERCGHTADGHGLDDYGDGPLDPTDPAAKFRCKGPERSGPWTGCDVACPDFVGEAITFLPPSPDTERTER